MNLGDLENKNCPRCGRDRESCKMWGIAYRHFFPKPRGGNRGIFERDGVAFKFCKGCSQERPLSEFWRNREKSTGVFAQCKPCCREKKRVYYAQLSKGCRRCGGSRQPKCAYCGPCRIVARKESRQRGIEAMRERGTWVAGHKACKNRRKARLKGNGGTFTGQEWRALCERLGNTCLACGAVGVDLTVDHVVPLSKGGRNGIENVQPLCRACNLKKGDKMIDYRQMVAA